MVSSKIESALPASLSAVFDSSDEDDQGAFSPSAEAPTRKIELSDLERTDRDSAFLISELSKLTAEHREAGTSCCCSESVLLPPCMQPDTNQESPQT